MPRRALLQVPLPGPWSAFLRGRAIALLSTTLAAASATAQTSIERDTDRIDITGRQNLTLGSGARAFGMGGAFLARADDATAASWNPAGLSYLRVPEVTLVGAFNSFDISRSAFGLYADSFQGRTIDFAAFTWPVTLGGTRGAVQLSYQRAVSFDGQRRIEDYDGTTLKSVDAGPSNGGFDVVALGTGLRLTRSLRAGFTLNRWINGYDQRLDRTYYGSPPPGGRPYREFVLDFRPRGWTVNAGLMWSPIESLNVGAVFKTGFTADVSLDKTRSDSWGVLDDIEDVTQNAYSSKQVRLDFPSSWGVGLSWRPRDTLTLSADFTVTRWSQARIYDYFDLPYTPLDAQTPPPPTVYPELQYPVTTSDDQQDKQDLRLGAEWVLIEGAVKVPLRAGYFNDRQIIPDIDGKTPRFDGFTAGVGVVLGSVLLDVAYVYEFGKYDLASDIVGGGGGPGLDVPSTQPERYSLTTNRVFASIIYRFNRRR